MAQFKSGKSGNPAGRPKGAKDKRTELRQLLEPHKEKLIEQAVTLALNGDTAALRMCLERLIPPLKTKDTSVNIGKLEGTLTEQGQAVLHAMTEGRITPDEASSIMQVITAQARIIEIDELEERIAALEGKIAEAGR